YIGVNNVDNNPKNNEVAVFREFTFEVADALINKISSFTKIEYIRMFDQLKARILQRVTDIEQAIASGSDYVAEMKTVKEQGVAQINQTVTEGKAYIDSVIAQAQTNINDTATSAIGDVDTAKNNAISTMNDKVEESISNVENVSNDAVVHVDDKLNEFNQAITDNEFVQPETLQQTLDNLQWQKHKITENDGYMKELVKPDLAKLDNYFNKTELVYVSTPQNSPHGIGYSGFIKSYFRSGGYGVVEFQPYNSNSIYQNRRTGNAWNGWVEITNNQSDTGWIPFQLINGALSNTAYKDTDDGGFDCAYRTITNGSEVTKKLRINGTNLTPSQVIAQLPSNFAKNAQAFPVRVPNSSPGGYVVIRPSGRVNFYVSGDTSRWNEPAYIYGECTWHD
ncbi:hypothetical protein MXF31_15000, partial [Mammaliicoccus sciuri]|uniref:pyocin knob domain-containing protein n=1 Tax=Mammaliicoccus sciuri TaxID=1296 RepID=UPI002DBB033F